MERLRTSYLGLELRNPIIAGASSLTSSVTTIKALEQAGVGALVISSLFEEQIQFSVALFAEMIWNPRRTDEDMVQLAASPYYRM